MIDVSPLFGLITSFVVPFIDDGPIKFVRIYHPFASMIIIYAYVYEFAYVYWSGR